VTYKSKPKKQTTYPKLLNEFEKKRHQDWTIDKASQSANTKKVNPKFQAKSSQLLQRFSGKRGK